MEHKNVILVVSHDPARADVRKQRLEEAGYEVIPAMNIRAVREACENNAIDLAVVGHSLPPAEKRRVWLEIREKCGPHVPIVELRNDQSSTMADSTVILHYPEKHNGLAERVRWLLET
jgi:DNA-binding response OmpR family regulator